MMSLETDLSTVFDIKIEKETEFNKQRGTIITWKNNLYDEDDDIAISFQDKEGVKDVWKLICEIQGKVFKEDSFDYDDEEEGILPDPTLDNISSIAIDIGSSLLSNKINKIQQHIICDRVSVFIKSREE